MAQFTIAALCIAFFYCSGQFPVGAQLDQSPEEQAKTAITALESYLNMTTSNIPSLKAIVLQAVQTTIENVKNIVKSALEEARTLTNISSVDISSCEEILISTLNSINSTGSANLMACGNSALSGAQSEAASITNLITTLLSTLFAIISDLGECVLYILTNPTCSTDPRKKLTETLSAVDNLGTRFTNGTPAFVTNAISASQNCLMNVQNQVQSLTTGAINEFNNCSKKLQSAGST